MRKAVLGALFLAPWGVVLAEAGLNALLVPATVGEMRLSPDGSHIAWLERVSPKEISQFDDGWLLKVGKSGQSARTVFRGSERVPDLLYWLNETRLLLRLVSANGHTEWLALERNGLSATRIAFSSPGRNASASAYPVTSELLDLLPDNPVHFLLSADDGARHVPQVFRVNSYTGERSLEVANEGSTFRWMTDRKGRIRLRTDYVLAGSEPAYRHYFRQYPGSPWRPFYQFSLGASSLTPLAFSADNKALIVSTDIRSNTRGIFHYDPVTATLGELIYGDARADLGQISFDESGTRPALVNINASHPEMEYLDSRWASRAKQINQSLPDTHNRLVSQSQNGKKALILAYSDRHPGAYYLFDDEKGLSLIAEKMPQVDAEAMRPTEVLSITTRDGLTLPAYLTRPKENQEKAPLVLYVHGGPWARDSWGFDPMVQWLAVNGYAVLQVNYRGSAGLGRSLLMAGRREWGRKMQDDLVDAADTVIQQNYASDRVCLLGSSYGGYAALMGVIRDQERFQCALAYAPVSSISSQMAYFQATGNVRALAEWHHMVGDPEGVDLNAVSPVPLIKDLKRPVLLGHGELDTTVPILQSESLLAAAREADVPIRWLKLAKTGHALQNRDAYQAWFKAVAAFLEQHLAVQ